MTPLPPLFTRIACVLALGFAGVAARAAAPRIDADFPGGNIIVDGIEGDTAFLRPDLRDTQGDWFYWAFRVRGAAGRTLTFTFASDRFSARGPAVSADGGKTWRWLGRAVVRNSAFRHTFGPGDDDVRFSVGMPYTEEHLRAFLQQTAIRGEVRQETLTRTPKGRDVELLSFGRLDGEPRFRVFFAARHHACEMMANYTLEGVIAAVLAEDEVGRWFRAHVECRAVPFMDKDGVEDGDQGKNRRPHDHNRDYAGEPIYASVAAVKRMLPAWSDGKLRVALDLHCPALRGRGHEVIHFVGGPEADHWARATRLAQLLENLTAAGPLSSRVSDNLAWGQSWNKGEDRLGHSFGSWVRTVPGLRVGSTLEIPYARANGQEVNSDAARAFGRALAAAIRAYLLEDGGDSPTRITGSRSAPADR